MTFIFVLFKGIWS